MQNKTSITLLIYTILAVVLFPLYRYYAISDFVPYADIASKYLNGNFYDAINGIWGPLISWLLVPFLWLKIDPLFSFKILSLLIGGLSIVAFSRLMKKFSLQNKTEWLLLLLLIPIILSFAFLHTTPDLLIATILMFYLNIVFDSKFGWSKRLSVYAGILGGIAYFAKHYAFPFITIHLILTGIFKYFSTNNRNERKKIIVNIAISYFIFLAISSTWIFAQSYKYNFFTIGTSGAYNHAWMSEQSLGQAPEHLGLQSPHNPTANSMWEDLTYYTHLMPGYDWSMFNSRNEFSYQVKLVNQNLKETFIILNKFAIIIGPLILLWSLVYVIKKIKQKDILSDKVFLSLIVIALYSSGYLLIRTSDRYIWISIFLFLLFGGLALEKISKSLKPTSYKKISLTVVLIIFSLSFLFTPLRRFKININEGKNLSDWSQILKNQNIHGNIASNKNWTDTSIMSFFLNTKYYGMPKKDLTDQETFDELNKNNIDFFLEWTEDPTDFNATETFTSIPNLTVHKLK